MEKLWLRESLLERISQEARHITVVSAPAGYGKTSLGAEIVGASKRHVYWMSLSRRHRDATCLIEYLCSVLGTEHSLRPDVESEADWLSFVEDLVAGIQCAFCIAIDDFHKISGAKAAERIIDCLVKSCPVGSSNVIILTRSPEGLRLGDMSMRGHVVHLAAEDLSFDEHEILLLFSEHFEIPLTNIQAREVWKATGGWAICLVLLRQLLSVKQMELWQGVIDGLASNSTLSDFLAQEVFEMLDADVARKLCIISLMTHFEPDILINAGIVNAREVNPLLDTGFFVQAPDSLGQKMHPVVRAFLKKRHDEMVHQEETAELHAKFASTLCGQGRFAEALPHLESAGQWLKMADLLDSYLDELLRAGQYETAIFWFERLPESVRSPNLYVLFATACESMARYEDALEASRTAANLAEAAGQNNVLLGARLRELKTLQWTGQHRIVRSLLKETTESDPEVPSMQWLEMELVAAYDLLIKGEHLLAANSLRRICRKWKEPSDHYGSARLTSFRAFFMAIDGRPMQARELLLSIEPISRQANKEFHTLVLNLLVGTEMEMDASPDALLAYHNQLSAIEAHNMSALIDSTCLEIMLTLGRLEQVAEELVTADSQYTEWRDREEYQQVSIMVARQYRLGGDFDRAQYYLRKLFTGEFKMGILGLFRELEDSLASMHDDPLRLEANLLRVEEIAYRKHLRWVLAPTLFTRSKFLLQNGDVEKARRLRERALCIFRRGGRAHWLRTETESDPAPLSLCLREGVEPGFITPILIRAGSPAARQIASEIHGWPDEAKIRGLHVLGEIADTSTLAAVRRQLRENHGAVRDAAREALTKIPSPDGLGEKYLLTPREVDVLRELAGGLTNKQIAAALFISEKTVKTYVNRIFYKLGVTQRVQAAVYYKDNFPVATS